MKKRFTLVIRNKKYNMINLDTHDLYIGLWQIFKALWKNRKNYTLYINK